MAAFLKHMIKRSVLNPTEYNLAKAFLPYLVPCYCRTIYGEAYLGLDGYKRQRLQTQEQMGKVKERFLERMKQYLEQPEKNMIFTDDLKHMVYLADSDEDLKLTVQMMKQFNIQNEFMRFGSFRFGPVVMRMYYYLDRPVEALEAVKSEELQGFFDQVTTYVILMDLLYKNKLYQEVLEALQIMQERNLEAGKFPRDCLNLVMAACYQLNTPESYQHAMKIAEESKVAGRPLTRKCIGFLVALALNQNVPAAALAILSTMRDQNYITVRNLKMMALADLDRVEDVFPMLRYLLERDAPELSVKKEEVFESTLIKVRNALDRLGNQQQKDDFDRLVRDLEAGNHLSKMELDEVLCQMIVERPMTGFRNAFGTGRIGQGSMYSSRGPYNQRKRYLTERLQVQEKYDI